MQITGQEAAIVTVSLQESRHRLVQCWLTIGLPPATLAQQ